MEAPARNAAEEEPEHALEEQGEAEPQDRGGASVVRQPEGAEEPQPKRSAVEAQRGEKRPADTPVEDIDPQVGHN